MIKHDLIIALLKRELPKIYLKWEYEAQVDNGGCGFVAKFIYDGFASLGYNPQVRALLSPYDLMGDGEQKIKAVQDLILSKDNECIKTNMDLCDRGLAASHYMLYWNNKYIDMSGCYDTIKETKDWSFLKDGALITPDILKRIASSYTGWNTRFRSEYIDDIENDIKNIFSKIKSIVEREDRFHKFVKFHESGLLKA